MPRFTLLFSVMAVLLYVFFEPAPEFLVFDRQAILNGQWWRLVSGHWVHSDLNHAVWDISAFVILAWILETCETKGRSRDLFGSITVGTVVVDLWIWYGIPGLNLYCGLSGILNTMLLIALFRSWKKSRNKILVLTGIFAILKIGIEILQNDSLFVPTLWPSVPQAHAAGFLAGLVVLTGLQLISWIAKKVRQDRMH